MRHALRIGSSILFLAAAGLGATAGDDATLDRFDTLLQRYVSEAGVRYEAWRKNVEDQEALSEVVATLAATEPGRLAADDRHALYINLYNAKVLELVLEMAPKTSIRDIAWSWGGYGVFFRKYLDFDGRKLSLNALEKRLRRESGDPRIHFAVNCGARSCPPLPRRALRGATLDARLDALARAFLAGPGAVVAEPGDGRLVLRISKIFDWYKGDFASAGGVETFVRDHAPERLREEMAAAGKIVLAYQPYDWKLNRAAGPGGS